MSTRGSLGLFVFAFVALGAAACKSSTNATFTLTTYKTTLLSSLEVPPNSSTATGNATITVDGNKNLTYTVTFSGLTTGLIGAHIHAPAAAGTNANIIVAFTITNGVTSGTIGPITVALNTLLAGNAITPDSLITLLGNGNAYVNVHSTQNPGGEIRGWLAKQ